MARRVAKRIIGIQDNSQNTYRKDVVSTSIRSEAVIPAKVGLTTYKVDNHDERRNNEAMRLQLDLVDEVRAIAKQRLAQY